MMQKDFFIMGKDEEQVSEKRGKIIYNQERFMNFHKTLL